jgi:hypothetical protein
MVCFVEVVEQSSAATDQSQQSTSAAMILDVRFQVHGQVFDPLGQHRDLQFRRSRIRFISAEFLNQLGLAFPGNRHSHTTNKTGFSDLRGSSPFLRPVIEIGGPIPSQVGYSSNPS